MSQTFAIHRDESPRQKVFSFSFDDKYSFSQFVVGKNTEQLEILRHSFEHCSTLPQLVYIYGITGSGCTHLLQASCQENIALGKRVASLSLLDGASRIDNVDDHIDRLDMVAIDDLKLLGSDATVEYCLFSLFNHAVDVGCDLLFAADKSAVELDLTLPDLQTRLASCLHLQFQPIIGDDLRLFVKRLFQIKRIDVDNDIIDYLLNRYDRSCSYLRIAVETLEQESLRLHRPITKALIRDCLKSP